MPNITEITATFLDNLIESAEQDPRKRSGFPLTTPADPLQSILIAIGREPYHRPQKHRDPDKSITISVLRGKINLLEFDPSNGNILDAFSISKEGQLYAAHIPADTDYMVISTSGWSIFLEAISGPYDPSNHTQYSSWAPEEESDQVPTYLEEIRKQAALIISDKI